MQLYDNPLSPNCRKVRAVAYELGLSLQMIPIDIVKGGSRTPEFLAKNPNGRVPLLEDGDLLLWESNAIISYLAGKAGRLLPTNPRDRAEVDRWMSWQLAHLGPALRQVAFERIVKKLTGQGAPDPAAIEAGMIEVRKACAVMEASLGAREYLAGALSVADFALAAHFSVAPAAGIDVSPYPKLNAWLDRMLKRDSLKRAIEDARQLMGA
ncbi:MAG: glutathione S-transferase family protein [Myxococcota bacterium]